MNLSDVAVATITRVRKRSQERVVRRSIGALAAVGLPVAMSDRGSSRSFVDWAKQFSAVTVAKKADSLVGQVQASLAEAHTTLRPFILYTEPDKRDFFVDGLADFVERASIAPSIGIHLAVRSASALATFPPYQRMAETGANELCRRVIGTDTDYFYGPFLVRRELVRLVFRASTDLGWGWRPFCSSRPEAWAIASLASRGSSNVRATNGASRIATGSIVCGSSRTMCTAFSRAWGTGGRLFRADDFTVCAGCPRAQFESPSNERRRRAAANLPWPVRYRSNMARRSADADSPVL